MNRHLHHQPEPEGRLRPRFLDRRVLGHVEPRGDGAAYGFDEDELARLLAEASRGQVCRSPLAAEQEYLEPSALCFL